MPVHAFQNAKECLRVAGATSPQFQPISDGKHNNLDRIEHPLYNCFTRFTGRNHRLELQIAEGRDDVDRANRTA